MHVNLTAYQASLRHQQDTQVTSQENETQTNNNALHASKHIYSEVLVRFRTNNNPEKL
jgi:hypothetical protein